MKYEQDIYGNIQLLILLSYSRQPLNGLFFVASEFLLLFYFILLKSHCLPSFHIQRSRHSISITLR